MYDEDDAVGACHCIACGTIWCGAKLTRVWVKQAGSHLDKLGLELVAVGAHGGEDEEEDGVWRVEHALLEALRGHLPLPPERSHTLALPHALALTSGWPQSCVTHLLNTSVWRGRCQSHTRSMLWCGVADDE
eukprot:3818278-Rhodomonas_salina.1